MRRIITRVAGMAFGLVLLVPQCTHDPAPRIPPIPYPRVTTPSGPVSDQVAGAAWVSA